MINATPFAFISFISSVLSLNENTVVHFFMREQEAKKLSFY